MKSDTSRMDIGTLINKMNSPKVWHEKPIFCFTSDIDWASEAVLKIFADKLQALPLKLTLFMTHPSVVIDEWAKKSAINLGIHPNFLPDSSHGSSYKSVIDTCMSIVPEARGFRSHRLFDVTDITHILKNEYDMLYVSNLGTVMQSHIYPMLHESGLVHFPIFFEDGTHLSNELDLNIFNYAHLLDSPGIKVISFHPMNFVFNSPSLSYMRNIKDSHSRSEYQNLSGTQISELRNCTQPGIGDTVLQIIDYVLNNHYQIMSMEEMYQMIVQE